MQIRFLLLRTAKENKKYNELKARFTLNSPILVTPVGQQMEKVDAKIA